MYNNAQKWFLWGAEINKHQIPIAHEIFNNMFFMFFSSSLARSYTEIKSSVVGPIVLFFFHFDKIMITAEIEAKSNLNEPHFLKNTIISCFAIPKKQDN